jgi:integrase
LRDANLTTEAWERLNVDVLTRKLATDFEVGRLKGTAPERVNSVLHSVHSYLRQARVLFSERLLAAYADLGWDFPTSFHIFLHYKPRRPVAVVGRSPSDQEMETLFAAAHRLREEDPVVYVIFCLAIYTGLRRAEMGRMRWDWLTVINGQPYLEFPASFAKNKKTDRIPIAPELQSVLDWWRGLHPTEQYVLPGPVLHGGKVIAIRHEDAFRRLGVWIKTQCPNWRQRKKAHALRAYFGRRMRETYGLVVAQGSMRHSTSQLTDLYTGKDDLKGKVLSMPALPRPTPDTTVASAAQDQR